MNRMKLTREEALALAKMEAEAPFVGAGKHLAKPAASKQTAKGRDAKDSDAVRPKVASAA